MKLLSLLFSTPREKADDAISHAADLAGDAEAARVKANFYTCMLLDIDPNHDWWQFAWAKQKQFDAQDEHDALTARVTAATDRAHKLMEPFNSVKEVQHEPFTVAHDSVVAELIASTRADGAVGTVLPFR